MKISKIQMKRLQKNHKHATQNLHLFDLKPMGYVAYTPSADRTEEDFDTSFIVFIFAAVPDNQEKLLVVILAKGEDIEVCTISRTVLDEVEEQLGKPLRFTPVVSGVTYGDVIGRNGEGRGGPELLSHWFQFEAKDLWSSALWRFSI